MEEFASEVNLIRRLSNDFLPRRYRKFQEAGRPFR